MEVDELVAARQRLESEQQSRRVVSEEIGGLY